MDSGNLYLWKIRRAKTYSCQIIVLFITLFFVSCVSGQDRVEPKKPKISGIVKYGSIIVSCPEDGILYIDGQKIGKISMGDNKISDLTVGPHELVIKFDSFKIKKNIVIAEDRTNKIVLKKQDDLNFKGKIPDRQLLVSDAQQLILDKAYELLDLAPNTIVEVNGKRFKLDCVGTVSAIYYAAGIDLQAGYAPYPGRNGVSKLFNYFQAKEVLHQRKLPEVGDILFWDDTWDFNDDDVFGNDPLTHVGIVTKVDPDGTIHFVHEHIQLGIVVERMNLFHPDKQYDMTGKEINSPMHAQSGSNKRRNLPWLAGELWRECGGILQNSQ
ncbi:MAG: CHAP domain-containing protein [Spirochaetes bacterium]|nr:CHAP domain-containing protein [Spirochaetota bacterium]